MLGQSCCPITFEQKLDDWTEEKYFDLLLHPTAMLLFLKQCFAFFFVSPWIGKTEESSFQNLCSVNEHRTSVKLPARFCNRVLSEPSIVEILMAPMVPRLPIYHKINTFIIIWGETTATAPCQERNRGGCKRKRKKQERLFAFQKSAKNTVGHLESQAEW